MRGHRIGLWAAVAMLAVVPALPALAKSRAEKEEQLGERLQRASEVYHELLNEPDKGVPQALLQRAKCVAVIPHVLKGAIGYGARYGKGVISCRQADGSWSAPSFITLGGGSIGLQIGGESTDLVLFFMTDHGARSLISSKFTLGAKAGVAAGPLGRSAEASTDVKLDAEIYSYAKSKGLFAGMSLEGARLAADDKSNARYYGAPVSAKALLFDHASPTMPDEARAFVEALPH